MTRRTYDLVYWLVKLAHTVHAYRSFVNIIHNKFRWYEDHDEIYMWIGWFYWPRLLVLLFRFNFNPGFFLFTYFRSSLYPPKKASTLCAERFHSLASFIMVMFLVVVFLTSQYQHGNGFYRDLNAFRIAESLHFGLQHLLHKRPRKRKCFSSYFLSWKHAFGDARSLKSIGSKLCIV